MPGDELLSQGHGPHTDLVQKEAAGEDAKMSLILAHAEDDEYGSIQGFGRRNDRTL